MRLKEFVGLLPLASILYLTGCGHLEPRDASPQELESFLEQSKDPRVYGMHSYPEKRAVRLTNSNRAHDFGKEIFRFKKSEKRLGPPLFVLRHDNIPVLKALYDSTTPHTWVDLPTAVELDLIPLGKPDTYTTRPYHTIEKTVAYTAMCGKFHISSVSVENPIFQVLPKHNTLGSLTRGLDKHKPDIIMGNDLLQNFSTVQINIAGQWIQFGPGIEFKPEGGQLAAERSLQRFNGGLAVKALMDGYKGYFIIDTAGDFGIAMNNPSQATAGFKMDRWHNESVPLSSFADHGIPADSLPRVGLKLLRDCRMTLDFRTNKVYFEKPLTSGR